MDNATKEPRKISYIAKDDLTRVKVYSNHVAYHITPDGVRLFFSELIDNPNDGRVTLEEKAQVVVTKEFFVKVKELLDKIMFELPSAVSEKIQ